MSFIKIISWILLLLFIVLMTGITYPYFAFRTDTGFLLTKQAILHLDSWRLAFYIHISSSLVVLVCGGIQFLYTKAAGFTHRILGTAYCLLILLFAAPSGFVMALYANGGIVARSSFALLSVLWWYFTFRGYLKAREQNYLSHRAYMVRSFALTLSAITLRLYVMLLPMVIHLSAMQAYTLVSIISWVPNLLVAEYIIRKTSLGTGIKILRSVRISR